MSASERRCLECGKDIAMRGHARGCPLGEQNPTQPQEGRFAPQNQVGFGRGPNPPQQPGEALGTWSGADNEGRIPITTSYIERQVKALESIATSLDRIAQSIQSVKLEAQPDTETIQPRE